jgi:hypothetical protein
LYVAEFPRAEMRDVNQNFREQKKGVRSYFTRWSLTQKRSFQK